MNFAITVTGACIYTFEYLSGSARNEIVHLKLIAVVSLSGKVATFMRCDGRKSSSANKKLKSKSKKKERIYIARK